MTISYSTNIGGKPTYFVEKIWLGLIQSTFIGIKDSSRNYLQECCDKGLLWHPINEYKAKIHTIRRDIHNKWKAGEKMHMVVYDQSNHGFQFAPLVPVISTRQIRISNFWKQVRIRTYPDLGNETCGFYPNFRTLSQDEVNTLAINDGFDTVADFWSYFSDEFEGKIIHWTHYKY